MIFDMETLEAQNRYKILTATVTPRPIAWITTISASGVINAAPFSFFNVMGMSRRPSRSDFWQARSASRTRPPISSTPANSSSISLPRATPRP